MPENESEALPATSADIEHFPTRSNSILRLFKEFLGCLAEKGPSGATLKFRDVHEEHGRFQLWSSSMGAFQQNTLKTSLEYRLRKAPILTQHLKTLLSEIEKYLNLSVAIASGARAGRHNIADSIEAELTQDLLDLSSNSSDSDVSYDAAARSAENQSSGSEIEELFLLTQSTITNLFKASVFIQKQAPRDKYLRSVNPEVFSDEFDISHLEQKYPVLAQKKPMLLQRLGKANTRRRQYFAYRREHHMRISNQERSNLVQEPDPAPDTSRGSGANDQQITVAPSMVEGSTRTFRETEASTFEERQDRTLLSPYPVAQSVSSHATSFRELAIDTFPAQPPGALSGQIFQCPYCFKFQQFPAGGTEKHWKKHVVEDLAPYICTFEDCTLNTFEYQHTWIDHEQLTHRHAWKCGICPDLLFPSSVSLGNHLASDHPNSSGTQAQKMLIAENSVIPAPYVISPTCPFCEDEWLDSPSSSTEADAVVLTVSIEDYRRHVGRHLLDIAPFSLPRGDGPEDVDGVESGDQQSNAAVEKADRDSNLDEISMVFSDHDHTGASNDLQTSSEPVALPHIQKPASNVQYHGAQYQYRPIARGGIRLVRLHHDSPSEPLNITLVEWKDEAYEALSYTWGPSEISSPIRVDGYMMSITQNLWSALMQLRFDSRPMAYRLLWVDAICINQQDLEEKNDHVPRIGQIFANASRVIAWLGEEEDKSDEAFWRLRTLDLELDDGLAQELRNSTGWTAAMKLLRRPYFSRQWVIQELACARGAVVQCGKQNMDWSLFVDAVVRFASVLPQLNSMFRNSADHDHDPQFLPDSGDMAIMQLIKAVNKAFRVSEDGENKVALKTLEDLVCNISIGFETYEPRDVIYSVLGLACDQMTALPPAPENTTPPHRLIPPASNLGIVWFCCKCSQGGFSVAVITHCPHCHVRRCSKCRYKNPPRQDKQQIRESEARRLVEKKPPILSGEGTRGVSIVVDYRQPLLDLCINFFAFVVRSSKSLDIICRPWAPASYDHYPKSHIHGFKPKPSWMIERTLGPFQYGRGNNMERVVKAPLVSMGSKHKIDYSACRLKPFRWSFGSESRTALNIRGLVLGSIEKLMEPSILGTIPPSWPAAGGWVDRRLPPPDQFWRMLVADRGPNMEAVPDWYSRACVEAFTEHPDLLVSGIHEEGPEGTIYEYLHRVRVIVSNRRMMSTTLSNIGLAPANAQVGDIICILFGCSVPVVFRRLENDDCILVGECYVHGMMDGQAIEMLERGECSEEEFRLI